MQSCHILHHLPNRVRVWPSTAASSFPPFTQDEVVPGQVQMQMYALRSILTLHCGVSDMHRVFPAQPHPNCVLTGACVISPTCSTMHIVNMMTMTRQT
jgi:hypothetical protein